MKIRMLLLITVTLTTQLALAQAAPNVANLWIDTTGGSCTRQATPTAYVDGQSCSSIQAAQAAAQGGDVVVMKTGTYGSQSLSANEKTGIVTYYCETWRQCFVGGLSISIGNVTLHGLTGTGGFNSRPDITLTTNTGKPVVLDGFQGKRIWLPGSNITVSNGDWCNGTPSSTAENDCVQIWNSPSNVTLEGNVFHDWHSAYDSVYHNDMIQVYPGGANITVRGNKFYNGPTSNMQCCGSNASNFTFENNYLGAVTDPGNNITFGQGATSGYFRFRNNVVAQSGLYINDAGRTTAYTLDISGNIALTNQSGSCSAVQTVSGGFNIFTPSSSSTCGTNAKKCSPAWLNGVPSAANGYDIRLSASDTCAKDAGNPSSYAATDFYRTSRPQGSAPDAGAFEYSQSATNVAAPSNLSTSVR